VTLIRCAAAVALSMAVAASGRAGGAPRPISVGRARVLVISPHPDDATLAAGGLMTHILHQRGVVDVVQMTGGDAFPKGVTALNPGSRPTAAAFRLYGSLREQEAIHGLGLLGVRRSRIRLLGFPDEGLCQLAGGDSLEPWASPYTGRDSPPASEQIIPGARYRHGDVVSELLRIIDTVRPTLLVLPHSADEHPDHCATHALVHEALAAAVAKGLPAPRLLHYILHYPAWPTAPIADAAIAPPSGGHAGDWTWLTFPLTSAEQTAKAAALDAYRSQMLVMPEFLRSFERPNELFLEDETEPPFPCWCNGTNIAARAANR
jgi:LmbE family N-acetylglucosaminyl deacetylase